MNRKKDYRRRSFVTGGVVFGASLVGLVAVGLVMSGVLGGGSGPETRPGSTPAVAKTIPSSSLPEGSGASRVRTPDPAPLPAPVIREVRYADGETAYHEGRYAEALDLFTVYTGEHPGNAWGHYMFGLSAWKAGEIESAESGFRTALKLDPDHPKSRINLARVLLDDGRPGEARTILATHPVPGNGEAQRVLGRAYHNLGEVESARRAYLEAIRLDDSDVWAMNNLGLLLIETGRFEEALGPLARAAELRSGEVLFQNNLGIALERTGHYPEAAEAFRAVLREDDRNQKALANLGRVDGRPGETPVDLGALAVRFTGSVRETTLQLTQVGETETTETPEEVVSGEIVEVETGNQP